MAPPGLGMQEVKKKKELQMTDEYLVSSFL